MCKEPTVVQPSQEENSLALVPLTSAATNQPQPSPSQPVISGQDKDLGPCLLTKRRIRRNIPIRDRIRVIREKEIALQHLMWKR